MAEHTHTLIMLNLQWYWKVASSAGIWNRGHCDVRGKAECWFKFGELKGRGQSLIVQYKFNLMIVVQHMFDYAMHVCAVQCSVYWLCNACLCNVMSNAVHDQYNDCAIHVCAMQCSMQCMSNAMIVQCMFDCAMQCSVQCMYLFWV